MDDNKSSSQFPLPGIALVLVALGFFVFSENPFNPTRPDATSEFTSSAEDVRARLWQDPFEAVAEHKKSRHQARLPEVSKTNSSSYFKNKLYQDPHHRICNPGDTAVTSLNVESRAHTFGELECQIQWDIKSDVHILTVMVPGGIYAEDHETRIRSRYALVTALSKADYIPKDAEHIGYMDFSGLCDFALRGAVSTASDSASDSIKYCDWPATIPYEWFVYKEKVNNKLQEKSVLVLWLDESNIAPSKPLTMLDRLRKAITPGQDVLSGKRKITYDVIGPATSTILVQMYKEVNNTRCHMDEGPCNTRLANDFIKHDIRIFSPRATIDKKAIERNYDVAGIEDIDWFRFHRTIPEDSELVKSLLCELLHRGINPYDKDSEDVYEHCKQAKGIRHNRKGTQDHIVLIGEWDTVYSRNFFDLFEKYIQQGSTGKKIDWLHSYNYLRGIDGSTGKNGDNNKKENDTKKDNKSIRRPVGENQYDYLRRMGDQISDLTDSLDDGTIKAIGVVGSDAYDKLLVLQALRNRFQDVVFFTTDIDVRMLHKEENKWVRNLVVASGHGLSPKDEGGREIITFRDGYQTSLYLSVLKAIGFNNDVVLNSHDNLDVFGHKISAKIFEIGNSRAVEYSHQAKGETHYREVIANNSIYLLLSSALLLLLLYQASYTARICTVTAFLIVATVGALLISVGALSSEEFKAFFSGTSIWPAVVIRLFAAVLAFVFIYFVLKSLKRNINEIKTDNDIVCETAACSTTFMNKVLIETWGPKDCVVKHPTIDRLVREYLDIGGKWSWFPRVTLMSAVYFTLTLLFLRSFPSMPFNPFHGAVSGNVSFMVIILCVSLYVFLIFLVVDVTRLYARFVRLLSKSDVTWPYEITKKFCQQFGVTKDIAVQKLKIDLIVKRSRSVDYLIFLPFIILSLMIISRSDYFDRWHMPLQLAFVIILGACIALSSAVRLRRTAEDARKLVLDNLDVAYKMQVFKESNLEALGKKLVNQPGNQDIFCEYRLAERIELLIQDIRNIKEGPFAPLSQHPIVSAIAMPFGGVGGLYLIDYFANIGV